MSTPPSFFILGATGYIGGSVLASLLKAYPGSEFVVQYRKDEHKDVLLQFSSHIRPLKATLQDSTILAEETARADVVVNAADVNDLASAAAIINGLEKGAKARAEQKKAKAVYIHTSGTGELTDHSVPSGEFDKTVYDDANLKQIQAMPESRDHRAVTNLVIAAIQRGHFLGAVILPSCIYGSGTGPVNKISVQIPSLIEHALRTKQAQYAAPGTNVWSTVHIARLATLYTELVDLFLSLLAPAPPKNGFEHYVFATSTAKPHSWKDIAERVGEILKEMGELEDGKAVGKEGLPDKVVATNSFGVSSNAKRLVGWEDDEKLEDWLKEDVKVVVERFKAGKA